MANYQKIKGTRDFYGDKSIKLAFIENVTRDVAIKYGYGEIVTPIFENTDVFVKNVGEDSDVVNKEMYTFVDKGKRSITLRPEGTAAVARCFIENKMYASSLPITKLFYFGPMFRYEQPQTGRYREFRQFGVEVYGNGSYLLDCDVIMSAYAVFKQLGLKNIKLKINSIGNLESRKLYSNALKEYFSKYIEKMCPDCQRRINTNPMRILDCKTDRGLIVDEIEVMKNAPKINDYLTDEAREYFNDVVNTLKSFDIDFDVDYNLVRGLDYYTDTVFEFIIESDDELNGLALGGGGKYADMIKSMVGIDVPGIGYAMGVDRLISVMEAQDLFKDIDPVVDAVIIGLDKESKKYGLDLAVKLRAAGITCEMDYKNLNMKPQFKLCDKLNPRFIIIIGEEERMSGNLSVKNASTKTQELVNVEKIIDYIKK